VNLIVWLLRYVDKDGDLKMWQNAVVLKNKDLIALLEANPDGHFSMKLTIRGDYPKTLYDIFHILLCSCWTRQWMKYEIWNYVDNALQELILQSYPGVKFELQLPCMHCIEGGHNTITLFSESQLRRYPDGTIFFVWFDGWQILSKRFFYIAMW
jgi:hypothetical protein